jgi:hypothetical protein
VAISNVAIGQPEELVLLSKAIVSYEAAEAAAAQPFSMYMEWGDALRAAGNFGGAIEKYARAADLRPDDPEPRLYMALSFLDRARYGPKQAAPDDVLIGLGASSDYLSWMSSDGPYPVFVSRIENALARTGESSDVDKFKSCMTEAIAAPVAAAEPEIEHFRAAAALKICIDLMIERANARLRGAPIGH